MNKIELGWTYGKVCFEWPVWVQSAVSIYLLPAQNWTWKLNRVCNGGLNITNSRWPCELEGDSGINFLMTFVNIQITQIPWFCYFISYGVVLIVCFINESWEIIDLYSYEQLSLKTDKWYCLYCIHHCIEFTGFLLWFLILSGKYSFLLLFCRYGMIIKGIILVLWNSQNCLRQRRIIIYKCQLKPSSEI